MPQNNARIIYAMMSAGGEIMLEKSAKFQASLGLGQPTDFHEMSHRPNTKVEPRVERGKTSRMYSG